MIKKILLLLCACVLSLALAFAALIAYTIYANDAADNAARKFCADIRVGSDIDTLLKKAAQDKDVFSTMQIKQGYQFRFQGGVFHAGFCQVEVINAKVTAMHVIISDD
jgi:hypothetical protein